MTINERLYNQLKQNSWLITTSQVIDLGFSKTLLTKYVKAGLLERIAPGIYIIPEEIADDMYTLSLRSEKIIFSHDTALFLNNLSERTPFEHFVTIPSNSSLSKSVLEECVCFYVKPDLYMLGVIEKTTTFGNKVRCYNAERTICDILRSRNRLNEESVLCAIKKYAASSEKDLNLLAEYAVQFRVTKTLKPYLEVLL